MKYPKTIKELLTNRKFRKLSVEELAEIINHGEPSIYDELKGEFSDKKAENLIKMWKKNLPEPKLIFTERSLPLILEALGKTITEEGYVKDIKTGELEKDKDGDIFKMNNIIGIIESNWITKPEQLCTY